MFHMKSLFSRKDNPKDLDRDCDYNNNRMPNVVFADIEEYHKQSSVLATSDPINLTKRYLGGYTMKLKKGTSRIVLFRYLLSKMFWESETGLHLDEYLVLMELWLILVDLKDPGFQRKYKDELQRSLNLYSQLSRAKSFPLRIETKLSEIPEFRLVMPNLIMTPESFFGMKGNRNIRKSFVIQFEDSKLPLRIPSERYIGVGYKDKGTCRDPSIDASPSWQEVGSNNSNLDRISEENRSAKEKSSETQESFSKEEDSRRS